MTCYLRFAELKERGYFTNRTTLQRHIDAGLFPAPIPMGANSRAWPEDEVEAVDAARRDARDAGVTDPVALRHLIQVRLAACRTGHRGDDDHGATAASERNGMTSS